MGTSFMQKIKNHPLIYSLITLRGNARYCVYTEPLFSIPKTLYTPFATVYMYSLGITDEKIGLIASVYMFASIFSALFSGVITDKMGRRRATFWYDLLSWSAPCAVWMLSQNFWWFLVAALLNSTLYIPTTAWNCLLVEDTDKKEVVGVYSYVYISGQLAAVFAPVAAFMVARLSVVPAMRIFYGIMFVSITLKAAVLFFYSKETDTGLIRMEESKNESVFDMLKGYKGILPVIFKSRPMLMSLSIMIVVNVTTITTNNFFGLFITQNMGLPEAYLAYFPILRAAVMLGFVFGIHHLLYRFSIKIPMLIGLVLYSLSQLALVLSNGANMVAVVFYIVCEAFAFAIVAPGNDSIAALFIEPAQRAKILSVMTVIMLAVSAPFGIIAGQLSHIDRKLPFLMNTVFYVMALVIVLASKELGKTHEA